MLTQSFLARCRYRDNRPVFDLGNDRAEPTKRQSLQMVEMDVSPRPGRWLRQ
jgi:hypothetical protein